jgi:hypothetical protein
MDTPDPEDRLTLLERAQLLHDATLRRHGELLDRQEDELARHVERITLLERLLEEQIHNHTRLTEIAAQLQTTQAAIQTTQAAILDLLRRGQNGH